MITRNRARIEIRNQYHEADIEFMKRLGATLGTIMAICLFIDICIDLISVYPQLKLSSLCILLLNVFVVTLVTTLWLVAEFVTHFGFHTNIVIITARNTIREYLGIHTSSVTKRIKQGLIDEMYDRLETSSAAPAA